LIYSTSFIWNIFHSFFIINVFYSSCEVPVILIRFQQTVHFSTDFRNTPKYRISRKSVQLAADLFHADRQTDRQTDRLDKAKSHFSQLCERASTSKTLTAAACRCLGRDSNRRSPEGN
jgi:hypothetical protein